MAQRKGRSGKITTGAGAPMRQMQTGLKLITQGLAKITGAAEALRMAERRGATRKPSRRGTRRASTPKPPQRQAA